MGHLCHHGTRQVPLFVLIYEGIIAGCIDLDYAPSSVCVYV